MAAGADTVTFEIFGDVLCALGASTDSVTNIFENHRVDLCAIAAAKWASESERPARLEIGARDVLPLMNRPAGSKATYA
jgi:hypothetical protein